MSKKFNVSDLLSDKSKGKIEDPESKNEINQIPIEGIMSSDESTQSICAINRDVILIAAEINDIKEKTQKWFYITV